MYHISANHIYRNSPGGRKCIPPMLCPASCENNHPLSSRKHNKNKCFIAHFYRNISIMVFISKTINDI